MSKARELANLGNAYSDGALSNRNLIINGAMNVWQRGAPTTTSGEYSVDRFRLEAGGGITTIDAGTIASGTEPYALGFKKTTRLTNTTAGTDAGGDYAGITTVLEAQNIATSGWDYMSTSGKITLSFWVKSSVAGIYTARFEAHDVTPVTKNYSFSFTVSGNTWTKVVKTISGDSLLHFDLNADAGLSLRIWAYIGSNYTTPTNAQETWVNFDGSDQTVDQPQNWKAVSSATFEITGVQLEVGDTATPFEHRSYGQELALCQRYYQKYVEPRLRGVHGGGQSAARMGMTLPVIMRVAPSVTLSGTISVYDGGTSAGITGILASYTYPDSVEIDGFLTTTLTTGRALVAYKAGGSSYLSIDAEL